MVSSLHHPAGSLATDTYALELTPERAGWAYSGLRILDLPAGGSYEWRTGDQEMAVLPLSGGGCAVDCDDLKAELTGRASVFDGPSDFVYAPRDSSVRVRAAGPIRLALTSARCDNRLEARYVAAGQVPVELRGAGACSRQVHNFCAAGVFPADRLIAVEVITPAGNWSSYPPHKHDEDLPGQESELEEIYYFDLRSDTGESGAVGFHRVYGTDERPVDVLAAVRPGDVVCVPHGWHGPSMAPPGYDLYYLNVMAGPSADRAWLIRDDPDYGWIRGQWPAQDIDPRLPMGGVR
jgi:5-deoxy-glucuronate isomerase